MRKTQSYPKELLQKPIESSNGASPLALAVSLGNEKIVAVLLSQLGIDVNMGDGVDQTALSFAVQRQYLEIARMLLEKGATLDPESNLREPYLVTAGRNKDASMIALLKEFGAQ